MSSRTGARTHAREAARVRLAKANQDRRLRDEVELKLSTDFELARRRRDEAAAAVRVAELEMAEAAQALLDLDNSVGRVAELTAESESELRRLRKYLGLDGGPDSPAGRVTTTTAPSRRPRASPNTASPANTVSQQTNLAAR